MDSSLILSNALNPSVLFLFVGLTAVFFKSDFEIFQPIPKQFSLRLLFAVTAYGLSHEVSRVTVSPCLFRVDIGFEAYGVAAVYSTALPGVLPDLVLVRVFTPQPISLHQSIKKVTKTKCRRNFTHAIQSFCGRAADGWG